MATPKDLYSRQLFGTCWCDRKGILFEVYDSEKLLDESRKICLSLKARAMNLRTGAFTILKRNHFLHLEELSPGQFSESEAKYLGKYFSAPHLAITEYIRDKLTYTFSRSKYQRDQLSETELAELNAKKEKSKKGKDFSSKTLQSCAQKMQKQSSTRPETETYSQRTQRYAFEDLNRLRRLGLVGALR